MGCLCRHPVSTAAPPLSPPLCRAQNAFGTWDLRQRGGGVERGGVPGSPGWTPQVLTRRSHQRSGAVELDSWGAGLCCMSLKAAGLTTAGGGAATTTGEHTSREGRASLNHGMQGWPGPCRKLIFFCGLWMSAQASGLGWSSNLRMISRNNQPLSFPPPFLGLAAANRFLTLSLS